MEKNMVHSPLRELTQLHLTTSWPWLNVALMGVVAGAKAAVVAGIATAIPTMASAKLLPWARANLNHTAQALIISTVAGAAYFIVADKTVLATARRNSFNQLANADA